MSRRRDSEIGFGSDSFLDIIANMVGILIILIVIAGVRVSRQPVVAEPETPETPRTDTSREPVVLSDAVPADPRLTAAVWLASEPPLPEKPEPPSLPPAIAQARPPRVINPSAELQRGIAAAQMALVELRSQIADARMKRQAALGEEERLRAQRATDQQSLTAALADTEAVERRLTELRREYARVEAEFIGKQQELAEAENAKGPTVNIRHRYTPVSRTVEGREIHFHLKGGRVALVRLEELVDRMKDQLERQKDWLAKLRRHEGRVGPLGGFRLDYVIVRQRLSAIEEARLGGGVARLVPVLLKFIPEPELYAESAREALAPGSVFIRELLAAEPGATLTFWVYPDSFGLYRELQEFAHAEGFTIAARPLQFEDLITASPWGSKSAGQ